ncbi:hypothetical protein SAMN05428988_1299 [Chitinophaga sp. YR573]|uniref:hypothetical protein n=1 Tax=Chitinophaga sp. YR573 TaxID=1881040 RepID=UPI0008CF369A|nr:hypothetical protein [Chitinophaga sp. YR573]SEW01792.1 hypothetical protein SAMN05428988_1299 [Chitinophaga sp. YR573]
MKRIITTTLLVIIAMVGYSQTGNFSRVTVRDSMWLNGHWISSFDYYTKGQSDTNYIRNQFSLFDQYDFRIQGVGWFKEPFNFGSPSASIRIQRGSDTTNGTLQWFDENGNPRGYMGLSSRKNNAIVMYNPYGSLRFFAADSNDIAFGTNGAGGSPVSTRYHNGKWLYGIFKGSGVKDTARYTIEVNTHDTVNIRTDNGLSADVYYENAVTVMADFTLDITASFVIVDATGATITLPRPTLVKGRRIFVRTKTGAQTLTLFTPLGQIETSPGVLGNNITITGIPPNSYISDGSNWMIAY